VKNGVGDRESMLTRERFHDTWGRPPQGEGEMEDVKMQTGGKGLVGGRSNVRAWKKRYYGGMEGEVLPIFAFQTKGIGSVRSRKHVRKGE
jgi:hypothetical protein